MAIDLPPTIPPQLSTAEKIEAHAQVSGAMIEVQVNETPLRISGNRYLSESQIREIASAATTPSQAIRALNQAYYRSGHLLVTLYYAQRGGTVYLHVINGQLGDVQGPEPLKQHFSPLVGDEELRLNEFERRRVLADLQAERMGLEYTISYSVGDDPEQLTMVFEPRQQEEFTPPDLKFFLSNEGNRFVGRYFAGAGVRHHFWNGTEVNLDYEAALTEWGETEGGQSYDGIRFDLSKPTRFGLYGLELNHFEYEREVIAVTPGQVDNSFLCSLIPLLCNNTPATQSRLLVEGEVSAAALTGEQILLGAPEQRLTFSQRLDFVESEISLSENGVLQDESHAGIELGLKYFRQSRWLGLPVTWSAQGFAESGLSSDAGTFSTVESQDVVGPGKRSAEYLIYRPKLGLKVGLGERLTLSVDALSQLSDGKQLPQQKQFVLGGLSTMSAYLPGVLVGDSGSYVRAKLEYRDWGVFGLQFTPSLFVEYGAASYEDVSGELSETRSLVDAGFRLASDLGGVADMELVVAGPVSDSNFDGDVLESLEADFFWKLQKSF